MTQIILDTVINAPIQKVFNLSLNIDFHTQSASQTKEQAIAGVTTGQIGQGETVTWRGQHFRIWLQHTSIISEHKYPYFFVDEMIKGKFKSFRHEHYFYVNGKQTLMQDVLSYEAPYGILGKLFNRLLLKNHLTHFIKIRNSSLKNALEL
jgi:ligand-binding SRPBCC domain-containing protein